MYKITIRVPYFIILLFFISIACSEADKKSSSGYVEHPIEENLPHYGEDYITVSNEGDGDYKNDFPDELDRLRSYFNNKEGHSERKLSTFVGEVIRTDIESIDKENIVIFDSFMNQLITYNLTSDTSNIVAQKGSGPGDIHFGMEMSKIDSTVIISMQSLKVSEFHCVHSDCNYERTFPIDFSALSSVKIDDNKYAIFGQNDLREGDDEKVDREAVRIVDRNGSIKDTFGYYYDTDNWMLQFTMRGGTVRFNESESTYVFSHLNLPFIYTYNHDYSLKDIYFIEDFTQGSFYHFPESNSASRGRDAASRILDMNVFDQFILIKTYTHSDYVLPEDLEYEQSYYIIDLATKNSYYVGSENGLINETIYVTEHHLIKNRGGSLYLIEKI